ncbi:hypothetical protein CEUSTIGMA_g3626.t1 [Chlamydomonas eustigma]|uniref:Dynein regulatory complex protein 9 n=1 Tax=Chlamydomonas eustigma TaxID=1157962 RepID=A0A250WZY0_9CHLO|nr:hypothetical protein CEUSTIGMA_g3626.t1 [Chlamydomonas eustigma]|eukprot:GAX76182.1 hypothetical protein CEUSTIGMA_g3626.t1 [Chlamydomonas eustigma]
MVLVGEGKIPPEITRQAAIQTIELTPAECAHVHTVLKGSLEKLALVGVITVDPKVQAQELTQSVGEEITRMIANQKELERRFEELVSAQHVLRTLPNKSKLRDNQAELQQVAEALRQSTKQLCRNLKDNPNVAENMAKVASERQSLQLLISNTLNELDVFKKVQPMIESVMAQEAAEVQMKQTIEHERTTTAAVRQLRNDLKDEKIDHDEKIREKKKMVVALKEQLKEMKMSSAVDIRYQDKSSTAKNEHLSRLETTQLEDLRKELVLVQQQIEIETNVSEATEEFLRHLATKLQEQSINWSSRREDDLNSKEMELEQLRANHTRDTQRLKDMEERHAKELRLKQERESKKVEEQDRLEMEGKRLQRMKAAAVIIQAAWRGYSLRKVLKGGKGKGKGGSKGGKKKK